MAEYIATINDNVFEQHLWNIVYVIIEIDVDACIKGTVRTGMQVTVYDTWNLDSLPTEIASCKRKLVVALLACYMAAPLAQPPQQSSAQWGGTHSATKIKRTN